MMDALNNPNKKLFEDLEFLQNTLKEQKEKEKQLREDSQSWLPNKFQNRTDEKSRDRFSDKRYKTPWEAGGRRTKNEYENNKHYNYDKLGNNEDKDNDVKRTKEYNKRISRKEEGYEIDGVGTRKHKNFNKPEGRKEGRYNNRIQGRNYKYRHHKESSYTPEDGEVREEEFTKQHQTSEETKNVNRNWKDNELPEDRGEGAHYSEEAEQQSPKTPREDRNTKQVKWKFDNRSKSMDSKDYRDLKWNNDDGEQKKFKKSWKSDKFRSSDRNLKFNKRHSFRESSRERKNESDNGYKERFSKHGEDKESTTTNWKWDKDKAPSGNRNYHNKEFSGWKSNKSWKSDKFQSSDRNWKRNKRGHFRESNWDRENEAGNAGRDKFHERWNDKDTTTTNWKWGKKDHSPSRNKDYNNKEFKNTRPNKSWKSDKFQPSDRHLKYEKRDNSEERFKFKRRDHENNRDFKNSRNQQPRKKFQKVPSNPKYFKERDKENDDPIKRATRSMSMVTRREWGAAKTKWGIGPPLKFPLKYIFCMATNRKRCFNLKQCTRELTFLQERHTSSTTCPDIKYSFFIGTNGTVYECRGWRTRPGLPQKYETINKDSLFIALAGKYNKYNAPPAMISARDYVIDYGVKNYLIDKDYTLRSAVDHATMRESDLDDQQSDSQKSFDEETDDNKTEDQETEDQKTRGEETEDQEIEDQETVVQESEDQEIANQEIQDEEAEEEEEAEETEEAKGIEDVGSSWEDDFAEDLTSVSDNSLKSWVSYKSSWDLSEGDLKGLEEDLSESDDRDGEISGEDI